MPDDISDLGYHPGSGYYGAYTRNQTEDAYPNGTIIKKVLSEPGDSTPNGTLGTVLGSLSTPDGETKFYFVAWEDKPRYAIGVVSYKIGLENDPIQGMMEEVSETENQT